VRKIPDYTLTTTEVDMRIPVDQQQAMVFGLIVYALMAKWADDGIINNAEARWQNKKREAINSLMTRDTWVHYAIFPDEQEDFIF
jgi:hypothetical protein